MACRTERYVKNYIIVCMCITSRVYVCVCICSESDIAIAILRLVEMEKIVVEGAGATGLAACLSGQLDHLKGKT